MGPMPQPTKLGTHGMSVEMVRCYAERCIDTEVFTFIRETYGKQDEVDKMLYLYCMNAQYKERINKQFTNRNRRKSFLKDFRKEKRNKINEQDAGLEQSDKRPQEQEEQKMGAVPAIVGAAIVPNQRES